MTADDVFDDIWPIIPKLEGGYQCNPEDPGNWTGGKIGEGELKGTFCGLSAETYPDLDLQNMSFDDAKHVYYRDWWSKQQWGVFAVPIASKLLACGIDIGVHSVNQCLQRAIRACGKPIDDDGIIGRQTEAMGLTIDPVVLLPALRSEIAAHYRLIVEARPAAKQFLGNWLERAYG